MLHRRVMRRALPIALLAAFIAAPPAAAGGVRTAATWGTIGLWGGWTSFSATWRAYASYGEGTHFYQIERFEMQALVQGGKDCGDLCASWVFKRSAQFLNSAGVVVASLTPPGGICNSTVYDSRSLLFSSCRAYYSVPLTVKSVRVRWSLSIVRRDGWVFNLWSAIRTVPLI